MSARIGTIVLALMLPLTAGAQESSVPVVAVVQFSTYSLSPGEDVAALGDGFASMMTSELADRPEVQVVDRQRVRELIEKRQLALSRRMEESEALRLGQLLGADYIVYGSVWLDPKEARLDLHLVDVRTSGVKSAKRQGDRDDFLTLVTGVADEFTSGLEGRVRVAEAAVEAPATAVLAYSRGLNYEKRGMPERAAEMYRKALELFPRHDAAEAALGRVSERGGNR